MAQDQHEALAELANLGMLGREFHHGDCVGADASSHYLAWRYSAKVVVHPPSDPKLRAFVHRGLYWDDEFIVLPEKPYHERNRDIVDACDLLIACPKERGPVWHGGTWYTIHYAEKVGKPVTIIWPDGTTNEA